MGTFRTIGCLCGAALTVFAGAAEAALVISNGATQNMRCSNGTCDPTAPEAVLNTHDLEMLLASGSLKVTTTGSGFEARDIEVADAFGWNTDGRLTLEARDAIHVDVAITLEGNGSLAIATGTTGTGSALSFGPEGHVSFASLAGGLSIGSRTYKLVRSIKALAKAVAADPYGQFALANDYDAGKDGTYSKSPVDTPLRGQFDGMGHTVSNLTIVGTKRDTGLFADNVEGEISDIALKDANITSMGGDSTGTLVAENAGALTGAHATGTVTGYGHGSFGGLVGGNSNRGYMYDDDANVAVTVDGGATVGGLAGYNNSKGHDSPAETVPTAPHAARIDLGASTRMLGVLAAIVVLLLVGIGAWTAQRLMRPAGLPSPAPSSTPSTASVAVLPFVNMSGDPAKEYLGDGIAEEITNALANTARFRVASRTSAFFFKNRRTDIKDVARRLQVAAVLEGSVRQQGSRIRIVAQLIKAADGFHLWSASYDRDLSDVLAVQEDIARAIAATVEQSLPGKPAGAAAARNNNAPHKTINPEAYTAYLQGLFSMNRSGEGDFLRAADLFNKAVTIEPDYAEAHAALAIAWATLYFTGERRDTLAPAAEHAAAALRLEPDNPTALLADAHVKINQWRWQEADSILRRLLREHPDNAEAHHVHAYLFIALDLWEKAAQEERRAAELDPFVPGYRHSFAEDLYYLRRYDEAFVEYNKVLALEPNYVLSLGDICMYDAPHGHLAKAREILTRQLAPLYGNDPNAIVCSASVARAEHDDGEVRRIARFEEKLYADGKLGAAFVAYPYAFLGEYDKAVGWLEKAYDDRDFGIFCVRDPALPDAMRGTPRWRALMQRPAFQEIARVRQQILARDS